MVCTNGYPIPYRGVTIDEAKYNYSVLTTIPWLKLIKRAISCPRWIDAALKDRLIKSFVDSAEKKLRKVIKWGDRRSLQFLRRMRDLMQNSESEEMLKSLWL